MLVRNTRALPLFPPAIASSVRRRGPHWSTGGRNVHEAFSENLAGWAVVTIVVGVATTGCGRGEAPVRCRLSPRALRSGRPYPPLADYTNLLIKAIDIGPDFTASDPVQNPNDAPGVSQLFTNGDNSRRIGDMIMLVNEAETAKVGLDNTKNNYGSKVTGTWQPVDVGDGGAIISGAAPDNSQAVTVCCSPRARLSSAWSSTARRTIRRILTLQRTSAASKTPR